jgi:hypothetical protein
MDPEKPFVRGEALAAVLARRRQGATLKEACRAAGIHIATLMRWQARHGRVRGLLEQARLEGWRLKHPPGSWRRPRVPTHPDCPRCGGEVGYRTACYCFRFVACRDCGWASWRPRAPWDCPHCGGAMLWSHSRKSTACLACGLRIKTP